jgi:hypothetical protein
MSYIVGTRLLGLPFVHYPIYDSIFNLPNLILHYLATHMFGHKLKGIIWIFYLFLLKNRIIFL